MNIPRPTLRVVMMHTLFYFIIAPLVLMGKHNPLPRIKAIIRYRRLPPGEKELLNHVWGISDD